MKRFGTATKISAECFFLMRFYANSKTLLFFVFQPTGN